MALKLIPGMRGNNNLIQILAFFVFHRKGHRYRKSVENYFSSHYNGSPVALTASGRSAIYFILNALPQKKVFIPAYTCNVVVEAATFAGKEIHYVHSDENTFNSDTFDGIDNDSIVLATHQYGLPSNIEKIVDHCRKAGAVLLEDCAQSLGSKVNEVETGLFGDYAIVSFNMSKLLTLPDSGGLIVAKDQTAMSRIENELSKLVEPSTEQNRKTLRHGIQSCLLSNGYLAKLYHYLFAERHGRMQTYEHDGLASERDSTYFTLLAEWKCALLMKQIKRIDRIIERRKEMFAYYDEHIHSDRVIKPVMNNEAVCCRYTVRVSDRFGFYKACLNAGIGLQFSHRFITPPHISDWTCEHCIADSIVNIPFYYRLTNRELRKVVKTINSY